MQVAVHNQGDVPIVLGNECGGQWMSIEKNDGSALKWDRTCACACGSTDPSCMCGFMCRYTQQLLMPGESVAQAWDGYELRYDDSSCYTLAAPAPGAMLAAKVCWDQSSTHPMGVCTSQEFQYGDDTQLSIAVQSPAAQSNSTTIVIENHSGEPIEVLKNHCGSQGWFSLDMGDHISVSAFCPCTCNADFKPDACPTCGQCSEDVYETVADGAKVSQNWDGKFWFERAGCSNRYDMPASMQVNGKVCWRKPASSGSETCRGLPLHAGQTESALTVVTD